MTISHNGRILRGEDLQIFNHWVPGDKDEIHPRVLRLKVKNDSFNSKNSTDWDNMVLEQRFEVIDLGL